MLIWSWADKIPFWTLPSGILAQDEDCAFISRLWLWCSLTLSWSRLPGWVTVGLPPSIPFCFHHWVAPFRPSVIYTLHLPEGQGPAWHRNSQPETQKPPCRKCRLKQTWVKPPVPTGFGNNTSHEQLPPRGYHRSLARPLRSPGTV